MKILVEKETGIIVDRAQNIELLEEDTGTDENPTKLRQFTLFDETNTPYRNYLIDEDNDYYIFDSGNDPIIEKELWEADLSYGKYCIENGCIVLKGLSSLNEIREVKRNVQYIINTLEVNQLELMYELSLIQLGLSIK